MKPKRIRWAGNVARMAKRTGARRVWWGKPEERGHLEELGVD